MGNKLIQVWSLRRSGAHGVVEWLSPQLSVQDKELVLFYNNASEPKTRLTGAANALVGLEDKIPERAAGKNLMVIRDPYNLIASRYNKWKGNKQGYRYAEPDPEDLLRDIQLWKDFVAATYALEGPDSRAVVFENWFRHEDYRRELSEWLGLEFTDVGLNKVNKAYGSTFDGFEYDGKAQQMDVLFRYRAIESNPYFDPLFDDIGLRLTYDNLKEM